MSDRERVLREASTGNFDMRKGVGCWWSRAVKKSEELRKAYSACGRNYEEQRKFRARWALEQADTIAKTRVESESVIHLFGGGCDVRAGGMHCASRGVG